MKTFAVHVENRYIGDEMFVIVLRDGRYEVMSDWEEKPVFKGSYKACVRYLENRWTEYQESTIG